MSAFPKTQKKVNPRQMMTDYRSRMRNEVEDEGVTLFEVSNGRLNINDDYLTLPSDITEVISSELGEYLNAFTQQKVYMRTLLGYAELTVEDARRKYYSASENAYRKYTLQKMTEVAKERLINAEPEVRPSYETFQDAKRKQAIVLQTLESIEDILFMLSREITRRGADFTDEQKNSNRGRNA